MAVVVDTNVLVRFADRSDPLHTTALRAILSLRSQEALHSTSQNLVEL